MQTYFMSNILLRTVQKKKTHTISHILLNSNFQIMQGVHKLSHATVSQRFVFFLLSHVCFV